MARVLSMLAVVSALVGCATASQTYTPDGRQGYVIDCSGSALTWGKCYEKAGDVCGASGYDIVSQTGDQGGMMTGGPFGVHAGSVTTRSLVIACKSGA